MMIPGIFIYNSIKFKKFNAKGELKKLALKIPIRAFFYKIMIPYFIINV